MNNGASAPLPSDKKTGRKRFGWTAMAILAVLGIMLVYGLPLVVKRLVIQTFKISSGAMQPTLIGTCQ